MFYFAFRAELLFTVLNWAVPDYIEVLSVECPSMYRLVCIVLCVCNDRAQLIVLLSLTK